ncbi:Importin alpha subunit (Karyopherin alpha subunit) (Serine-rich RNA polymerase I suppressor protein) [Tulasnella sp. 417]|nr:Importin alpha subunit (Karyopherin alpha subunit) (Serine-rich RNA polymerase I suppressor protein) [Tulasnella sp. 417]
MASNTRAIPGPGDQLTAQSLPISQNIVDGVRSDDCAVRLEATTKLRRLLTRNPQNTIQSIIRCSILPSLIGMLSAEDIPLMRCSASILLEVTASSSEEIQAVADEGAIPKLVSLFSSDSDEAKDYALSLLGNISGDCLPLRNAVMEAGGFALFLDVLENPGKYTHHIMDVAVHALAFCTRLDSGGPFSDNIVSGTRALAIKILTFLFQTNQMISVLAKFIQSKENEPTSSVENALLALGRIVLTEASTCVAIKTGITPQLVQLASPASSWPLQHHALRCLAVLTLHGLDGIDSVIEAGGLETFGLAITSTHFENRSVGCSAAHCVLDGTPAQVKSLIASSIVPALAQVICNEEYPEIRDQAILALTTLSGKARGDEELHLMVEAGSIEAFCAILEPSDYRNSLFGLQGIMVIINQDWEGQKEVVERLKTAGGVTRLRAIRDGVARQHQMIGDMAQRTLKKYFPESSQPARV